MAFERLLSILPEAARGGVSHNLVVEALIAQRLAVGVLAHCGHAMHGRIGDVLDLDTEPHVTNTP